MKSTLSQNLYRILHSQVQKKTISSPGYDIDIEADDIDVTDTVTVIWKIK